MANELSRIIRIEASTGTSGTSGNLSGPIFDTHGFESALGIAHLSASNASMLLKYQGGTATDAMSDTTGDVPGTLRTLYLDVHRPQKRYGRFVVKGATTTGAYNSLVTVLYGPRTVPTTHDASATGLRTYSPDSGTATG